MASCSTFKCTLDCQLPEYGELCATPKQGSLVPPCGAHTLTVESNASTILTCVDCITYVIPCSNINVVGISSGIFGEADVCEPCESSSVTCSGGFRALPKLGHWSSSESVNGARRCKPPAEKRCSGYNPEKPLVKCVGDFVDDLCELCPEGYYEDNDECKDCQSLLDASWFMGIKIDSEGIIHNFFIPACCIIALSIFIVVAAKAYAGGTWTRGLYRAIKFLVWTAYVFQLFAQLKLGARSSKGDQCTTDALSFLYPTLALFAFDALANIPKECAVNNNPFMHETVYCLFAVTLCFLSVALHFFPRYIPSLYMRRKASKRFAKLRQALMVLLTLLFSTTTQNVYSVLSCIEMGDENNATSITSTILYTQENLDQSKQFKVRANHRIDCNSEDHLPAVRVAWLTFAVYIIGYPLVTFIYTTFVIPRRENAPLTIKRDKKQARLLWQDFRAFSHFCYSDFVLKHGHKVH